MRKGLEREFEDPFYTRGNNPTVEILRKKMAALEGAEDALIFSSGSTAISAAVINSVKAGDHVICVQKPYSWTNKLLNTLLARFGVETTMVDARNEEEVFAAIKGNTTLIMLESPNSATFEMQDLEIICTEARKRNIRTVIDNSYSTPLYQNPISLGADIVCHSASKYIGGHSDVVAGVLCSSSEIVRSIFEGEFMTLGGNISPFDAWLLLRGVRTLQVRLDKVTATTKIVIEYLENHPKVDNVFYPFAKQNPQLALAEKQMKGGGGLFSLTLKTEDIKKVEAFSNSLQLFLLACSWGGYESLQFPQCTLYGSANYKTSLPFNMIRFYIGLEEPEEIIEDFERAFAQI